MAHTGKQKHTLQEMCRETLNSNLQIVFVSVSFMMLFSLPGCFGEPLGEVTL